MKLEPPFALPLTANTSEPSAPTFDHSSNPVARSLGARVPVDDRRFDRFLPRDLRLAAPQHWSPVSVAVRAAEWFDELGVGTVVDVGSGAGKFCVVAALAGRCRFVGLEQRPRLVATARALAETFGVEDRVDFVEATFGAVPAPSADAYYFYNSFGENLIDPPERLDEDVELGPDRFERDVNAARELMRAAPLGTYVLTYNGFGGRIPPTYERVRVDRETPNVLRAWRKTRSEP